jgi:hypothetical protein
VYVRSETTPAGARNSLFTGGTPRRVKTENRRCVMTHTWTRRLIEIVLVFAFVAEIWRFFTTRITSQSIIVDVIDILGLVIIGGWLVYMWSYILREG